MECSKIFKFNEKNVLSDFSVQFSSVRFNSIWFDFSCAFCAFKLKIFSCAASVKQFLCLFT